MSQGEHLTKLGSDVRYKYDTPDASILETFQSPKNSNRDGNYVVTLSCPEFTSLCPKTGQPDFATITIKYRPRERCVETKSLKLYLFAYRQHGAFMEAITNKVWDDLAGVLMPKWMEVVGEFRSRGGITLNCRVSGSTNIAKSSAITKAKAMNHDDDDDDEDF